MKIRDMFSKPIDREIKGVIKVGQDDDANVRQELEEYVVTRELQKHFDHFYSAYQKGINGKTDKMGVWISGFFGSGKSHFLKILSYLLENRMVDGKAAIDYFIEDNKISNSMVLANMKLAASKSESTDVIIFNIDSKSDVNGKQSKDAIVSVFLKVFNEMQGFCGSNPFLADLERKLTENSIYETFQSKFEESFGSSWSEARNDFDFIQDDIVDTLTGMNFMSTEAAQNWCAKASEPYSISIEDFAKMVKKYLDKKGSNQHIVFLVDEIGQYIGDDSKLMLNLQTITEDLGTACGGKAWIIVTSQQDIDAITKTKGNDFSKIQGRFDTRIALSAANVDEVVKKRILEKTETATQTLSLLYDQKATIIKNLILFNDGAEKKLYSDRTNFAAVYPFVPYQFNLLASVLTSIRTHGASGKHLAEGERSMLALFKESSVNAMNAEAGTLIPFNVFYDSLEQFLDHSHKGVISRAWENDYINPDREPECFTVNVLKTLFMIKYVKEITANVENITSLMVTGIDTDRIALTKKIEDALKTLVKQTLVQKNGELYVFLTDEEQEINREINNQNVEMGEVIAKVSEMIFDGLYEEKKYRYPAFNGRYSFGFNQYVDDRPYKNNQNNDIGLKILTPNWDGGTDETTLRMMSGQEKNVIVILPSDAAFLDEVRSSLKIDKYLRFNVAGALSRYEQIKDAKRSEMRERTANARLFLTDALRQADIYVNGDKAQIQSKEIVTRINEALGRLVTTVYHKLSYIDAVVNEDSIRKLLSKSYHTQLKIENEQTGNRLALNDVLDYISGNTLRHAKTSNKSIVERFTKAPYGFIEDDIAWLLAKLFRDGEIAFIMSNEPVTLFNKTADDIIRYLTRREFAEKLLTEKLEKVGEPEKRAVRDVMKELFNVTPINDEDDALMRSFKEYTVKLKNELEMCEMQFTVQPLYPGKAVVKTGKKLMNDIIIIEFTSEFYRSIAGAKEDYLKFAEDYEPVKTFFAGEQKGIFDKALHLIGIYNDSKTFIAEKAVEDAYLAIKAIASKPAPFSEIFKLPELTNRFLDLYGDLLNKLETPVLEAVAEARKRVFDELTGKRCHDSLIDRYIALFDEIKDKAKKCNNVATLQNIKVEADALKVRLLNEIAEEETKLIQKANAGAAEGRDPGSDYKVNPDLPKKKQKTISIKSISLETTWQLETEADIDRYVSELKMRLKQALEEDTVINVEF